ncbi:MAG: GHMP kinase, partial [Gemmatimonadales bacterium]|nr:GHMP kinase [Gemmatimonadales bacterium]
GLRHLGRECPGFDLHATDRRDVEPLLAGLPDRAAGRVRANLVNRDLTVEAMRLLREGLDRVRLGELFTKHHEQLRDGIRVSTPKIDRMLEAALEAGALGGKINGSGGGGCMFAYAPGREAEVAEALERAGGRAYPVTVDDGARSEV